MLVAEQLALGERVIEGGETKCADVGVGGRVFGGAPGVDVLRAEFVVGNEADRDRHCRHRVLGEAGRVTRRLAIGQHVANVGLVDHLGAAVVFGGRQADVYVDTERLGDFFAQILAEGATGDPADDLANDEAEGDHVIALRGAGLPPRFGVAMCSQTASQSRVSVGVRRVPGPMTPERWPITMATVMSCFPAWANSGQYSATGACRSSSPRSARR